LLVTNIAVSHSSDLQPSGYHRLQTGYGYRPLRAPSLFCSTLNPKKARQIMFGFVMVLTLVLMTVAPPFAVVARAKAKSSRR